VARPALDALISTSTQAIATAKSESTLISPFEPLAFPHGEDGGVHRELEQEQPDGHDQAQARRRTLQVLKLAGPPKPLSRKELHLPETVARAGCG
jgi:hypothetical protein